MVLPQNRANNRPTSASLRSSSEQARDERGWTVAVIIWAVVTVLWIVGAAVSGSAAQWIVAAASALADAVALANLRARRRM